MTNTEDFLLLEDATLPEISFSEYRELNEGFKNFLPSDVEKKHKHAQEVFDMIQKSYADQGGIKGTGFGSPQEMVEKIPMWKIGTHKGKIVAVALYKDAEGRKRVAMGTDGTPEGKDSAVSALVNDLKQKRAHAEISGKSLSFLRKHVDISKHLQSYDAAERFHSGRGDTITRPLDSDPEVIRHPDLKPYMYSRPIGGHNHTKVMIGYTGNNIEEATVYDKRFEKQNGKDSALSPERFMKGEWNFKPKIHVPSQAKERRPEWTSDDWHTLHDKVHGVLTDYKKQYVPQGQLPAKVKNGEVLFYSRKQKQGYFTNIDHQTKEVRMITVLPPGKSRVTKPDDQRIVLDHVEIPENTQIIILD